MALANENLPSGADLTEFEELGKVPWEVRAEKIAERFPTVATLDWEAALERDVDLFGRIVRDILKLEQAVPGRPGPRPSLDVPTATRRLQQFFGRDFTIEKFPAAFRVLAGDRSVRHLAALTDLNRNCVHKLLQGTQKPDGYTMSQVAEAFGKHPSYFLEWRLLYLTYAMWRRLEWSPETSIDMYRRVAAQRMTAAV